MARRACAAAGADRRVAWQALRRCAVCQLPRPEVVVTQRRVRVHGAGSSLRLGGLEPCVIWVLFIKVGFLFVKLRRWANASNLLVLVVVRVPTPHSPAAITLASSVLS